jgi:hypothetical protein
VITRPQAQKQVLHCLNVLHYPMTLQNTPNIDRFTHLLCECRSVSGPTQTRNMPQISVINFRVNFHIPAAHAVNIDSHMH